MIDRADRAVGIETLRRQIARLEGGAVRRGGIAAPSSGWEPLDRVLPAGGFARGTLVEWLAEGPGDGAQTLALLAARAACADGGTMVVLDDAHQFYPPAAARLGIELERLLVVQPAGKADSDWALDQALRCPAVAAVLAWPDRPDAKLDGRTFRRLQLAAEESGSIGLLVRPALVRAEPSWAEVRLLVRPLPPGTGSPGMGQRPMRRLRIELLRCRGGVEGQQVDVDINDETHTVHLVA